MVATDTGRAENIGLVNKVVTADGLAQDAQNMAAEMTLNDPLAVRLTKSALGMSVETAGLRKALEAAMGMQIESTDTPESREFNKTLEARGPKTALSWRATKTQRAGEVR